MEITYTLIRSKRKTMALQVKKDGEVVVRAPLRMPVRLIQEFVASHQDWICQKQAEVREKQAHAIVLTDEQKAAGIEKMKRVLPERVSYWAGIMGVTYQRITIRDQKTRWGSCSSKGNLNFNWKLALVPPEVLDYVVVHELAHRIEMNHSDRFWAIVKNVLPDYKIRKEMLKQWEL